MYGAKRLPGRKTVQRKVSPMHHFDGPTSSAEDTAMARRKRVTLCLAEVQGDQNVTQHKEGLVRAWLAVSCGALLESLIGEGRIR